MHSQSIDTGRVHSHLSNEMRPCLHNSLLGDAYIADFRFLVSRQLNPTHRADDGSKGVGDAGPVNDGTAEGKVVSSFCRATMNDS